MTVNAGAFKLLIYMGKAPQHRLHTACRGHLPAFSEEVLQFLIVQCIYLLKRKALSLNEARYFFTVFRDASAWAAIDMILRPLLYILKIFLILLMLIVELAMFGGICCLRKMVASTAFATR